MSKECVTHHFACDCREEKFKELEQENKQLRQTVLETLNQRGQRELIVAWDRAKELERENAALRADIHAHEQINKQLIEDKRRLDFLGQTKCAYYYEGPRCWRINEDKDTDGDTLRAAIDAARKETQP